MRSQKKATRAANAAWHQAVLDGRVLRFPDLGTLKSYPTIEARDAAFAQARASGLRVEIAKPIQENPQTTARDVVNDLMINRPLPYSISRKFGLSAEQGLAIYDLAPHAFGPGGAGYEWAVKQVSRIIAGPPRERNPISSTTQNVIVGAAIIGGLAAFIGLVKSL